MCCLTCTYFDPTEPEAHKIAREAGRCEAHCGKEWNWLTAIHYVQEHVEPLHGVCRFSPEGVKKSSWGVCGQHKPILDPQDNRRGVTAFRPGDYSYSCKGLIEWSQEQYRNIKQDKLQSHLTRQETRELERQNRELRRQLVTARKRSASRLAKLQKVAKVEPKPVELNEPVAVLESATPLRLVVNG